VTYLYAGLGMAMLTAIMAMFEMATSFVGASVSADFSYNDLLYYQDGKARDVDQAMMCLEVGPGDCESIRSSGFYKWDDSDHKKACDSQVAAAKGAPNELEEVFDKCRCDSFTNMLDSQMPNSAYVFLPGNRSIVCQASYSYEAVDPPVRLSHRLQVVQNDGTYSFFSCVRRSDSDSVCGHET
jgi:hypothetical protein